jgi:hypothetical protein
MGVDVGTGGTVDTFATLALAVNTRPCEEPHPKQLSTAHHAPAAQPIRRETRRHAPTGRSLSDRGGVLMQSGVLQDPIWAWTMISVISIAGLDC